MITFPKAKINLGLRVVARRPDGFHDIETVFYPVCLADALEFVTAGSEADNDQFIATGIDLMIRPENNIVFKTMRKVREKFNLPFLKIHLHKAIPPGSGLGGGSSDAAFLLKAIIRQFGYSCSREEIYSLALELGSDCPFFIDPIPSYASGRGEILKPVEHVLKGYYIILLDPGIRISTREAYFNCTPATPGTSLEDLIRLHPSAWRRYIINDFENYAIKLYPKIGDLKALLYKSGAIFSSMTGSGSAIYGIFSGKTEISEKLKKMAIFMGYL
ncbi:MAG: 4-(cytidine 5'-diphospho)-2-C-methyl-D-erythritol kinase [Bacteroidales bacterium]|jgi:4-diphosphocytidyl-2-C-methyl-D-erythritol kinase